MVCIIILVVRLELQMMKILPNFKAVEAVERYVGIEPATGLPKCNGG